MRRLVLAVLILASVALLALGVWQMRRGAQPAQVSATVAPATSADHVRRIAPQDLHARLQAANPPLVWDFRSATAYAEGHIAGARQMPSVDQVEGLARGLDKAQPIVTLCA